MGEKLPGLKFSCKIGSIKNFWGDLFNKLARDGEDACNCYCLIDTQKLHTDIKLDALFFI